MTSSGKSTNSTVLMDKYYGKLNIQRAPQVHTVKEIKKEKIITRLLRSINIFS